MAIMIWGLKNEREKMFYLTSQDILRNVKKKFHYFQSLTWFLVAIPSLVGQCGTV